MSAPQFTPGPWRVGPVNNDPDAGMVGETAILSEVGSAAGPFCPAVALPFVNAPEAHGANARLIAAAPELYAELDHARELLALKGVFVDAIDDALAKARGEQ